MVVNRFGSGILFLAAFVAPFAACTTGVGGEKVPLDDPRVKTVLDAVRQWKDSWATMRLTMRYRITNGEGSLATKDTLEDECQWILSGVGDQWMHDVGWRNGKMRSRRLLIFRADRWIGVGYPEGESDFARPIQVTVHAGALSSASPILPFFGFHGRPGEWFGEMVPRGELEILKDKTFEGRTLPHWRLTLEGPSGPFAHEFVLDPQFAHLPREYVAGSDRATGLDRNVVEEFREAPGGIVIPWKGRVHFLRKDDAMVHEWEVTKAEFNAPVQEADLAPPLADGTIVSDQITGETRIHGNPGARFVERPKPPDLQPSKPAGAPVDASQPASVFGGWWNPLTILGILIVGVGAFLLGRSRR